MTEPADFLCPNDLDRADLHPDSEGFASFFLMSSMLLAGMIFWIWPVDYSWAPVVESLSSLQSTWWRLALLSLTLAAATVVLTRRHVEIARYVGTVTVFTALYPVFSLLHGFPTDNTHPLISMVVIFSGTTMVMAGAGWLATMFIQALVLSGSNEIKVELT